MEREDSISGRIEALQQLLKDPDERVRQKAAESLSRIEAKANFDTYIRMLGSDDKATRIQVIHLLAEMSTNAAIKLLQIQMSDPHDDVRTAVIRALGDNSGYYREPGIREKAVDIALMGLEDVSPSVRASAADTLGKFRNPRAVDALLTVLTSRTDDEAGGGRPPLSPRTRLAPRSEDAQLVVSVLLALGEIGDRKAVPDIIKEAGAGNPEIKEAALKALGMLGDPRAESCLIEALASDHPRIRMQAAESLSRI